MEYTVFVTMSDNSLQVINTDEPDLYLYMRLLDKCAITKFTIILKEYDKPNQTDAQGIAP